MFLFGVERVLFSNFRVVNNRKVYIVPIYSKLKMKSRLFAHFDRNSEGDYGQKLEDDLNEFFRGVNVQDVQYQVSCINGEEGTNYSALVLFEEGNSNGTRGRILTHFDHTSVGDMGKELEQKVNDYIANKEVSPTDVKFAMTMIPPKYGALYSALVLTRE